MVVYGWHIASRSSKEDWRRGELLAQLRHRRSIAIDGELNPAAITSTEWVRDVPIGTTGDEDDLGTERLG
jgi:hypothetical protein